MNDIEGFRRDRSLISLRRELVDDQKIQGFILAASEKLILLQHVYDFRPDGLMLLRTEDVSDIDRTKTDAFQQDMLAAEGVISALSFENPIVLTSWRNALTDLRRRFRLVILECELMDEPEFAIGEILELDHERVLVRPFSGVANWEDPVELPFDDLTSCQVDTSYINAYQRYFDRKAQA